MDVVDNSFMLYGLVVVVGLVIGSFLNVCIHRLPVGQSVVSPGSHCPSCKRPIRWRDNVPILSFFLLKGRCHWCQHAISYRYPVVELMNAAGYLAVVVKFGWHWASVAYGIFFSALLVVTWIDLDHQIIPDVISLPGILLGLILAATILPLGFINALVGVLVGGGVLWGLAAASPLLFGKEGLGGGDIKLLAMIGAFLGWQETLLTLMIAAIVGSIIGVGLIAFRLMGREQYIPFGPFLSLGALLTLFFKSDILQWYREMFW